jgi:hypothetical protein
MAGEPRMKPVTLDQTVTSNNGRPKYLHSESLLTDFVKKYAETDFDRRQYSDLPDTLRSALEKIAKLRPPENQLKVIAERMADLPSGGGADAEEILKALKKAMTAARAAKLEDQSKQGGAEDTGNKSKDQKGGVAGGDDGTKDASDAEDGTGGDDENDRSEDGQSADSEETGDQRETPTETHEARAKRLREAVTAQAGSATGTEGNT